MDGIDVSCVVTPEYQPLVKNTPERMNELVKDEEVAFQDFVMTEARVVVVSKAAPASAPIAGKASGGAGKPPAATVTTPAAATTVSLNSAEDFTGSWEDWAVDS